MWRRVAHKFVPAKIRQRLRPHVSADQILADLTLPTGSSADDPYHQIFHRFIAAVNAADDATLVELGSRDVSGHVRTDRFTNYPQYIGFDVLAGPNVDIVGDAHQLSKHFAPNSVDFMFSISVFEHLMMPWKVALEMNKVLKVGGEAFISTHPTWSPHELPWDFFRFLQNSAQSLFNEYTGFEIVEVSEGLPCRIISLVDDAPTRGLKHQEANLGIAMRVRKTREISDLVRWDVDVEQLTQTMYPSPTN